MTETPTHDAPTEAEILELERLLSRATTRPWRHDVIESLGKNWLLSSSFGEDPDGTRPILTTDSIAGLDAYCAPPSDDIKAIAAVMNAAPRLLQAARQQTVATRPQGREELRAQHAAMLEMQDPLARTLLAVRDALQSLPEDALGECESGGACWSMRDELLTGVEHCLKLQRELKERSDTLAILSLPPQSLPVEVSDQAAIMALCERERISVEVTGDDYVDPVLEFVKPEYGEDGAGLQYEIAMMKRMIGEAYICDAIEPRPATGLAPAVTEEMIEEASGTFPGSRISASDVEAILTAALPHTKTEAQVQRETIEALALMFELDTLGEENSIKHDVPAVIRAQDSASLALLHAQKGKSDE